MTDDQQTITAITKVRLEDAVRYAEECETERDHAQAVLNSKQHLYEYAEEQRQYWERIMTEVKTFDERPEDG